MITFSLDIASKLADAPRRWMWAGRVLSGLAILALAMDASGKLFAPELMIANSPPPGLPADPGFYRLIGAILAVCTVRYAWPRTAVLGAVLAHLCVDSPLFTFTLVGVYLGAIVWAGLWLRDARARALLS